MKKIETLGAWSTLAPEASAWESWKVALKNWLVSNLSKFLIKRKIVDRATMQAARIRKKEGDNHE